jgi:hypothetical protein
MSSKSETSHNAVEVEFVGHDRNRSNEGTVLKPDQMIDNGDTVLVPRRKGLPPVSQPSRRTRTKKRRQVYCRIALSSELRKPPPCYEPGLS